ncbi:unnamed protein product, partial [Arctogadus glacialis]
PALCGVGVASSASAAPPALCGVRVASSASAPPPALCGVGVLAAPVSDLMYVFHAMLTRPCARPMQMVNMFGVTAAVQRYGALVCHGDQPSQQQQYPESVEPSHVRDGEGGILKGPDTEVLPGSTKRERYVMMQRRCCNCTQGLTFSLHRKLRLDRATAQPENRKSRIAPLTSPFSE